MSLWRETDKRSTSPHETHEEGHEQNNNGSVVIGVTVLSIGDSKNICVFVYWNRWGGRGEKDDMHKQSNYESTEEMHIQHGFLILKSTFKVSLQFAYSGKTFGTSAYNRYIQGDTYTHICLLHLYT